MQKEKLTTEHIAEDLNQYADWTHERDRINPFMITMCLALLAVLSGFLLSPWVAIPIAVLAVGSLIWMIIVAHRRGKVSKTIRKHGFTVTTETLTSISEETARSTFDARKVHWTVTYFLYFGAERYRLYDDLYPWSKDFHMTQKGVLNTSIPGDEFWVARDTETQEIGAVYNKKFFDYEP